MSSAAGLIQNLAPCTFIEVIVTCGISMVALHAGKPGSSIGGGGGGIMSIGISAQPASGAAAQSSSEGQPSFLIFRRETRSVREPGAVFVRMRRTVPQLNRQLAAISGSDKS